MRIIRKPGDLNLRGLRELQRRVRQRIAALAPRVHPELAKEEPGDADEADIRHSMLHWHVHANTVQDADLVEAVARARDGDVEEARFLVALASEILELRPAGMPAPLVSFLVQGLRHQDVNAGLHLKRARKRPKARLWPLRHLKVVEALAIETGNVAAAYKKAAPLLGYRDPDALRDSCEPCRAEFEHWIGGWWNGSKRVPCTPLDREVLILKQADAALEYLLNWPVNG